MNELGLPESFEKLADHLGLLHEKRKKEQRNKLSRPSGRLRLSSEQRIAVLAKTDGRCHLCGGDLTMQTFAADHVLAYASGGQHALENYLAAHGLCNGCRWFYSPEEFQWILRIGIWARKQMEDKTSIGLKILPVFFEHEKHTRNRRKRIDKPRKLISLGESPNRAHIGGTKAGKL